VLSAAYATTADGSVVVGSGGIEGNCGPFGCQTVSRAFIWDAQHGMRDLATVLTAAGLDLTGWTLSEARGISANGRVIVGTGTNPDGNTEAWRADLGGPPPCYANCDGSTTAPVLNINDFVCFQSRFAAGDSYANCDGSTTAPVLTINDYVCFQGQFAAGCP
jgi:uncharacterized membrane protein